jgi:putrescine aminotransferase
MNSKALFDLTSSRYMQHANPGIATLTRFMGLETVEHRAEGCYVYGPEGEAYLDCLGGPGVFTIGHRHPAVVEAMHHQLELMALGSHILLDPVMAEAAEKVAALCPGDIQYVFFCNSGAEAVEGALKAARMHTGRPDFVCAQGGFHGKTFGALSASGRDVYKTPFEPLLAGFTHVPFGDESALAQAVTDTTAAVLLEPIQCENGIIIPPAGYLQAAREICDRNGALLILDEIQTGLGRTGRMWACDEEKVTPDIITLGKALGGGMMPVGAFAARPAVWDIFEENPYVHTSTFGGNPLACRAVVSALEVIVDEDIATLCARRGEHLLAGMQQVAAEFSHVISQVRGKGLLVGVEFPDSDIANLVIAGLIQEKILTAFTLNQPKVVRLEPPAVITEAEIDRVVQVFAQAATGAAELLQL